jgi:hypothetical protein
MSLATDLNRTFELNETTFNPCIRNLQFTLVCSSQQYDQLNKQLMRETKYKD